MNYDEIKTLAYAYADRADTKTLARYDDFLRIAESNMNRKFKTIDATHSTTYIISPDADEVVVPADFGGVNRVRHYDSSNTEHEIKLASSSIVEEHRRIQQYRELPTDIFYYITVNGLREQVIRFSRTIGFGSVILAYYRKVPELTSGDPTNWVSDNFPDAYAFGVRAEIAAFVKNMESAGMWEGRFEKVISEMVEEDKERRWDGEPMQMRTQ